MNPAKKGLGRGLSALFGDIENKTDSTKEIKKILSNFVIQILRVNI